MEIEIKNLNKDFGSVKALNNLNITLTKGIYGILGPNGSGKSTLMNLLTDNLTRTKGEINYNGKDILKLGKEFRKIIGFMPQQQGFYDNFSAKTFLMYMSKLKGISSKKAKEECDYLLEKVNLKHVANKKISQFSGGMKQRVLLAQAMLGNPKIIILDEPTAGLDPKERINIRNLITGIADNKIILLATHPVSDIECIANEVILIKNGNLIQKDTPVNLIESISEKVFEKHCDVEEIEKLTMNFQGNLIQTRHGLKFKIVSELCPEDFTPTTDNITLEDVYMYYFECLRTQ
ncbi:MAG: ABC transporter ATP-binding protein [Clostridiales bacterium]|nr:ABC transporter ATP-binding protein [Clostridiales bacterium]